MATNKPTKPSNEFLPDGFATASGTIKNDFSSSKKLNGFSTNVKDIFQGDNINYMLDTIGKQLKYLTTVVDVINQTPIGQTIAIDNNNRYEYIDISGKEDKSNKTTSLTASSTTVQYPSAKTVYDALQGKQNTLSSGVNIKTINNSSILGSGNLTLANTALTNLTSGLSNTICATEPTTVSSATSANPAVVIENYVNGTSWYRVWSDGRLEQGGRYESNATGNTDVTISLLKNFKNTNYSPFINGINNSSASSNIMVVHFGARDLTTSSFKAKISGTLQNIVWYAVGQKA